MLRLTTRVCHSKSVVRPRSTLAPEPPPVSYSKDIGLRVMIPSNARPAHRRLRAKLAEVAQWNEAAGPNREIEGERSLGIISSGIAVMHAREAAPRAAMLKLGMTYPPPIQAVASFVRGVERCVVIEEGDPWLVEALRAAGIAVEGKPEMYRFGELNVGRVRRILAGDISPEPAPAPGKPPELCPGCPHRSVFQALKNLDCIVAGDIGCYSLGALAPFQALELLVCMGAAIGMGLGLRHVLPEDQAQRVVSVIGDSTFVHSGLTGLVEAIYNPPSTGHLLIILDNGTTAMTGMQEHPGTGRTLDHQRTGRLVFEDVARSLGLRSVHVVDPALNPRAFEELVAECLKRREISLIVARRTCLLATGRIKELEKADRAGCPAE
jgi:indolepyruvate ferredoxin oxidoreductase alpha subunit